MVADGNGPPSPQTLDVFPPMDLEPEQKGIENGENTERDGLEKRNR